MITIGGIDPNKIKGRLPLIAGKTNPFSIRDQSIQENIFQTEMTILYIFVRSIEDR